MYHPLSNTQTHTHARTHNAHSCTPLFPPLLLRLYLPQGKLYLLGGGCNLQVSPATPLEVYDPHIDAWFTCGSPLPGAVTLSEHALVANATEGLLLAFGGDVTSGDTRRHRSTRPFEQVSAACLPAVA